MCAKRRIALYGGTFDPVHLGHVEIARKVSELFEIETVLFVPARVAPHKLARSVTDPIHRYAMLVLATQEEPRFVVSTFELDAPDRRYTVDTVRHFQEAFGDDSDLFFIMGADSWTEITTWREWSRLLTMTNHIVVTRPGYDLDTTRPEVGNSLVDLRGVVDRRIAQLGREKAIFFSDVVVKDISATEIRHAARECRFDDLDKMVPPPVAEYIKKYGIYQDLNEA